MAQSQTKQIGKDSYEVSLFGAKVGRVVLFRLSKMLGPAIASGLGSASSVAALHTDGTIAKAFSAALLTFAQEASEADFTYLCDEFSKVTKVHVKTEVNTITLDLEKVFDSHFQGKYMEMIQWLVFAIQVNFESFLDVKGSAVQTLVSVLGAKMREGSESPKA